MTCPQCQEALLTSKGLMPQPFSGSRWANVVRRLIYHEDHDEVQKAMSYCPYCPGVFLRSAFSFRNPKRLSSHSAIPLDHVCCEKCVIPNKTFKCMDHVKQYCLEFEKLICPLCGQSVSLSADGLIVEKNKSTKELHCLSSWLCIWYLSIRLRT